MVNEGHCAGGGISIGDMVIVNCVPGSWIYLFRFGAELYRMDERRLKVYGLVVSANPSISRGTVQHLVEWKGIVCLLAISIRDCPNRIE
jgi:hypothetical protein